MNSAQTFAPADPDFERRVRESYAKQTAMQLVGATMERVAPGEVEIRLPASPTITQQHGFVHGGMIGAVLDTACGFASLSLPSAQDGRASALGGWVQPSPSAPYSW
mgnify:CR=1 FL=1